MAKGTLKKMLTVVMALLLCFSMMPVNMWVIAEEAQPEDLEIVKGATEADEPEVEVDQVDDLSDEAIVEEDTSKPAEESEAIEELEETETAEEAEAVEVEAAEEPVAETVEEEPTPEEAEAVEVEAAEEPVAETVEEEPTPEEAEAVEVEVTEEPVAETVEEEPTPEETVEIAEEAVEEPAPTFPAFADEQTVSGVKVSVKAEEGVFPEGATLSVKKVSKSEQKKVDNALEEVRADDSNVVASYTFDIKVLDKNGNEVQPKEGAEVKVFFELAEADNDNLDTQVYHIAEDTITADAVDELSVKTEGETVIVETDGFSYYTVEFTYNDLQYVMEGDTIIALADILAKVGLSGEVTAVAVSNEDLFSAPNESGAWMVIAHKAFTSTEWMKVTIDSVEYEIVVTDAIPGDDVTLMIDMDAGEKKTGNFSITGGPVRGPESGTATIEGSTVTNNADNDKKGGIGASTGSAFISRTGGNLLFDGVTINNGTKSLVINIWANASAELRDSTIDCSGVSYGTVPFLLVGAYNGVKGTLNVSGDSTILNANAPVAGGSGGSVINVNSGTLTITNSEILFNNSIKLTVKEGATLKIDGSTYLSGQKPLIKAGGTLDLTSSTVLFNTQDTIGNLNTYFDFEDGAIVKIEKFEIKEIIVNNGETAAISTKDGKEVVTKDPEISGSVTIGGKSVKVDADTITIKEKAPITVKSGGKLTFGEVALEDRNNITIQSGGKAYLKGTNTFNNCTISNSGAIYVEDGETEAEITGSSLTINGTSGLIIVEDGKTLTASTETLTPNGKQQVQVYGTFNLKESEVDLSGNGAIRIVRIEDGGTANITDSKLSDSTSLGVIRANAGATLNIENSTFSNNRAAGSGEQNNGGVILAWESVITITGSTFEENSSASGGGVIWMKGGDLKVSGSIFSNNRANGHGGAIYQDGGDVTIASSAFDGNIADDGWYAHGGAICTMGGNATLTVEENSTFTNNKSLLGSAIILLNGAKGYINSALFEGNTVEKTGAYVNDGGTIFVSDGSYLSIPSVSIHDNSAAKGGSGLYVCGVGTANIMSGAAAIYDNENGDVMQRHYPGTYGSETRIFDEALGGGQHNWTWETSGDGHNILKANSALASKPEEEVPTKRRLMKAANTGDTGDKPAVVLKNNKSVGFGAGLGANGTVDIGDRTQIRIYKVWNDNSNTSGNRLTQDEFKKKLHVFGTNGEVDLTKEGIEITIHTSGEFDAFTEVVEAAKEGRTDKVTATEDNWVIDITGLPEDEWPYVVQEGEFPIMYCSDYYADPASTDPVTQRDLGFFGFKNTYAEGKVTLEGTKVLNGRELTEGEFEFVLLDENDEEVGRTTCDAEGKFTFDEITYTLKEWRAAKEYIYYISEVQGEDNTIDYDSHKVKVTVKLSYTNGDTEIKTDDVTYEEEAVFTNTYAEGATTIEATKNLVGRELEAEEFQFVLLDDEEEEVAKTTNDEEGNISFELNYTLADLELPQPNEEESVSKTFTYTIKEVPGDEAQMAYDETSKKATVTVTYYTGNPKLDVVLEYEDEKVEFVNEAYTEITIKKVWEDNDNEAEKRPTYIEAKLWGNNKLIETVMLNEESEWKYTFAKLPLRDEEKNDITYVVTEDTVDGYETPTIEKDTVDRAVTYTITNKVLEEKEYIDISVTKVWEDNNDKAGVRPESVTISLLADGKDANKAIVLNAEKNWKGTFEALPKLNEEGKEIEYTIREEEVTGYTVAIEGDSAKGFTVTNSYEEEIVETTDIPVTKIWNDLNNVVKQRPEKVTFNLLANGKKVDSITLTSKDAGDDANQWKGEFKDLPVKDDDGKEIAYTVEEEVVKWYIFETEGDAENGFVITNINRPWIPEIPDTPGDAKHGVFTLKKTVSGLAEKDKTYTIDVLFTLPDGTTQTLTYKLAPNEVVTFDYVLEGTKVKIVENETGYTVTYKVDGTECQEFTMADGDFKEVVVNNDKAEAPKKEEKKRVPKTGDESNPMAYILILIAAAGATTLVYRKKGSKITEK